MNRSDLKFHGKYHILFYLKPNKNYLNFVTELVYIIQRQHFVVFVLSEIDLDDLGFCSQWYWSRKGVRLIGLQIKIKISFIQKKVIS